MVGTTIEGEVSQVEAREKNAKNIGKKVEAYLKKRLGIAPTFAVVKHHTVRR